MATMPNPNEPGKKPTDPERSLCPPQDLEPLSYKFVEAAEGFHMIGMYQATLDELAKVGATDQKHPNVLHLRCRAYWALRNIHEAFQAADAFLQVQPENPFGYCFKAMLFSYTQMYHEAYNLLKKVIYRFPGHGTMHYDLACAAAGCALWSEARHWVFQAICREQGLKQVALDAELLTPIKNAIEGMSPSD
jgi:hypothetical protein